MRDVTTLTTGELVYVHTGEAIHASGTFVGVANGAIIVDHIDSFSRTKIAGNDQWVTDLDGEIVGEPEPALATTYAEPE